MDPFKVNLSNTYLTSPYVLNNKWALSKTRISRCVSPTALLLPSEKTDLLEFDDAKITGECVSGNLYINIWGTNFPMWYDEDGRIRIKIQIAEEKNTSVIASFFGQVEDLVWTTVPQM